MMKYYLPDLLRPQDTQDNRIESTPFAGKTVDSAMGIFNFPKKKVSQGMVTEALVKALDKPFQENYRWRE